jgi:hypothetical protein
MQKAAAALDVHEEKRHEERFDDANGSCDHQIE